MTPEATAGLTAVLAFAAMFAVHGIGDLWVQRDADATAKGAMNRHGRLACARHVTTYTLTTSLAVGLVLLLPFGAHVSPLGFAAGQAFSAITHYAIDRRWTLLWLANRTGKRTLHDVGTPRHLTVVARKQVLVDTPAGTQHEETAEVEVPLDARTMGTGAYSLDQSLHLPALFVSALLTALIH